MSTTCGFDFVPPREEARANPRRRALEDFGLQPNVHEPLYRFVTDLLQAQPRDPIEYMLQWSTAEKKNPKRISTAWRMDMSNDKFNLQVQLKDKENLDKKKSVAGGAK